MGRVVAITGVCTEEALAATREFARGGDTLALISRYAYAVEAACAEARELGAEPLGVVLDTTDPDAVEAAVHEIEASLGPVQVLVTTAHDPGEMAFDDLCPTELRRVTEFSYLSHVHTTMTTLERMKERGEGAIVFVASPLADRGRAGRTASSGAEAALRGFHEALAEELADEGSPVRVALVRHGGDGSYHDTALAVLDAVGAASAGGHTTEDARPA